MPHVELHSPENRYIVNDFIYCQPGVFDHLEGFASLKETGVLSDYYQIRPKGMKMMGVCSSSDRVAGITVQADSLEEFNQKHRIVVKTVKVIDTEGKDIYAA